MHELGLCDAMLKMVRNIVKEEELEGVNSITVEVGTLSGVIPRFLSECWTAVTDGTELQDTEFIVESLTGTAECLGCGEEFEADLEMLRCPNCGGTKLNPLTGRDMTIKEIEGY